MGECFNLRHSGKRRGKNRRAVEKPGREKLSSGPLHEGSFPQQERGLPQQENSLTQAENMEYLKRFRPLDDTFMRCMFRDNRPLTEMVLKTITGFDDLTLRHMETQRDVKQPGPRRSLFFDVYGVDTCGARYDLEVQRSDRGASAKRARYHAGALDIAALKPRQDFAKLPPTYTIFVTENDVLGGGRGAYRIERTVADSGDLFEDEQHIIYANARYRGNDPLGDLMHDFCCSDPNQMKNPLMADAARYLKEDPEGVKEMCSIMDELREKSIKQGEEIGRKRGEEIGRKRGEEIGRKRGEMIGQKRGERIGEERAIVQMIRNTVKNSSVSVAQAMDILGIPAEDRGRYHSMI